MGRLMVAAMVVMAMGCDAGRAGGVEVSSGVVCENVSAEYLEGLDDGGRAWREWVKVMLTDRLVVLRKMKAQAGRAGDDEAWGKMGAALYEVTLLLEAVEGGTDG